MLLAASAGVLLTSCYFEGGAAYYPKIRQTVEAPAVPTLTDNSSGWSLSMTIGFYLDVRIKRAGLGVGASPSFNGSGVEPFDGIATAAGQGLVLRGDVTVPNRFLPKNFETRLTLIYNGLEEVSTTVAPETEGVDGTSIDASSWFFGPSIGYRWHVRQGVKKGDFLFILNGGVERFAADVADDNQRIVRISALGVGARFMIVPAFTGTPPPSPYASYKSPDTYQGKAGCYYATDCDVDGNCMTRYTCP